MSDRDKEREEEEKSGGFKVMDRRPFTPDGQLRTDTEEKPPQAAAPLPSTELPPQQPKASPSPTDAAGYETPSEKHRPVSFEHLVMSLATTAMFQLGLVKSPEEENPRVDLIAAKETIDLLEVLQQKTKGNLTEAEEGLLTGSLYELHMVFVDLSGNPGRVR